MIINASVSRLGAIVAVCLVSACDPVGVENNNDDNIAPGAPTGLQVTAPDGTHVQLQWTASPDSDTAGYRVFRSDLSTAIGTVTTTTYTDATVIPATTYGYFVVAFDDAAPPNESGPTPVVQIRTPSATDTVAPAVPTNVQAVASGPTQVNLTWDASTDTGGSGVAGYRIFRNGSTTPIATVAMASYSDINLTAGTAYMYAVRAFDGAGNVSGPSTAVSITTPIPADTTPPTVPGALTATAQGAGAVLLNWTTSTDASGIQRYEIQRDGVKISDAGGNATSFIDSTVSAGNTYTYAVRAIDGANNASAFSSTASATTPAATDTTPPTAPTGVAANATTSQSIVVTWVASTDAGGSGLAGYRIFRDGGANPVATVAAGVLTFTDTGRQPGTTYSYVVRAVDGDGNMSAASNTASATTPQDTTAPTVPSNVTATALTSASVRVNWGASTDTGGSGLAGYRIYRNGVLLSAAAASTTTFVDSTTAPNTAYDYRVSAFDNASNESAQSSAASVTTPADTTPPSVPSGLTVTGMTATQVSLSWSASTDTGGSGLGGYRVFRNGSMTPIATVGVTSYSDINLTAGTAYTYEVRAFDGAGNVSGPSTAVSVTTPIPPDTTPPTTPGALTAAAQGAGAVLLNWTASTDASGIQRYEIQRDGVKISDAVGNTTSFVDSTVSGATTYAYTIRAIDGANNASAFSNSATVTTPTETDTTPPTTPAGVTANATNSQSIVVTWQASTDAGGSGLAGYRIFRDGGANPVATVAAGVLTFTDTGRQPSTTYSYFVRAFDGDGNLSAASNTASATTPQDTTPPSVPTNVVATALTSTSVRINWSASTDIGGSGLGGYRIYRNGALLNSAAASATSFTDAGAAPNTTYDYRVSAFDNANNESAQSASAGVTTPADTTAPSVPGGLMATNVTATQVTLSWSASTDTGGSGLAGYRVFRNGGTTPVATVAVTSYTDINLTAGTAYTYVVRAFDGAGNVSGPSAAVSVTTPVPPDTTPPTTPGALIASAQGAGSVLLNWTASTDASGIQRYEIQRDGVNMGNAPGNATSFVDSTVSASTTYTYAVRAIDGANNASAFSNTATVTTPREADTTPPTVPGGVAATATSSQSIVVTWQASTDAGGSGLAGYRIFRDGGANPVATVAAGVLTFTDTGRQPNTTYSYVVRAFDGDGNGSAASNAASATTPQDSTPPSVPTNVVATALSSISVRINWSASTDTGGSGLAAYRIYRNGVLLSAAAASATTFTDATAVPNTAYAYRVSAIDNASNESAQSTAANVTTPADTTAPSIPGGLTVTGVTATQVGLSWSASTDTGGSGLAGYRVLRNGTQIGTPTATSFSDTTVVAGTTYTYTVRAADNAGNLSADSNPVTATPPAQSQSGLDSRPSNTTCIAPSQPTTNTSVTTERVFADLLFDFPILMTQAPGEPTDRWYIAEQRGTIQRFQGANPTTKTQWADLRGIVDDGASEAGLLGMAFHPNYAANGRVFLSYTGAGASPFQSHISEFRRGTNGLLDPTSERILIRLDQPFDNHNGGNVLFGPDGNLYIGFGDGGSGGDPGNRSQNRNLLFGKILRINVDSALPYTIPSDNPYAGNPMCATGSGSAPCPEIYAYGLRNPWRWSFDRAATEPDLWLADVGQDAWEEVDRIVNGGNYGWKIREGRHCFSPSANCPVTANGAPLIDPIAEYDHSIGQSTTGGYVYRGNAIPSLRGRYVFGDFVSGRLMYLATNASGGFDRRDLIVSTGLGISSFAEDAQGELYITNYSGDLYKIVPGSGTIADTIPANLIDTGCVSMADPKQPALGLIPYAPNAPFWSDGADKLRWMALPNGQQITIGADGDWSFPNGTVLVKNFKLGTQLIETRLFMRHPNTGNWGGYTYQWNAAQTAATLVKGGLITHIAPPANQDWIYPSEAQCLQCHTNAAGRSLGLETAQLNGDLTYPTTGRTANQLTTLNTIGMFTTPLAQPPSALPAYRNPYGSTGTVTERARAYLHTNCAQCHRPSGGTPSNMDLRFNTAIGSTGTCNVTPNSGDLGISGARLISPGNASNSLIHVRMSRRDLHQMPPLASNLVDTAGAALIQNWINAMNASCQ